MGMTKAALKVKYALQETTWMYRQAGIRMVDFRDTNQAKMFEWIFGYPMVRSTSNYDHNVLKSMSCLQSSMRRER